MIFKRQPKDPNARVHTDLAVLRQQHQENNQRDIGLMNMPKHQRGKQDLVSMGADAVPALLQALDAPVRTGTRWRGTSSGASRTTSPKCSVTLAIRARSDH